MNTPPDRAAVLTDAELAQLETITAEHHRMGQYDVSITLDMTDAILAALRRARLAEAVAEAAAHRETLRDMLNDDDCNAWPDDSAWDVSLTTLRAALVVWRDDT